MYKKFFCGNFPQIYVKKGIILTNSVFFAKQYADGLHTAKATGSTDGFCNLIWEITPDEKNAKEMSAYIDDVCAIYADVLMRF